MSEDEERMIVELSHGMAVAPSAVASLHMVRDLRGEPKQQCSVAMKDGTVLHIDEPFNVLAARLRVKRL